MQFFASGGSCVQIVALIVSFQVCAIWQSTSDCCFAVDPLPRRFRAPDRFDLGQDTPRPVEIYPGTNGFNYGLLKQSAETTVVSVSFSITTRSWLPNAIEDGYRLDFCVGNDVVVPFFGTYYRGTIGPEGAFHAIRVAATSEPVDLKCFPDAYVVPLRGTCELNGRWLWLDVDQLKSGASVRIRTSPHRSELFDKQAREQCELVELTPDGILSLPGKKHLRPNKYRLLHIEPENKATGVIGWIYLGPAKSE